MVGTYGGSTDYADSTDYDDNTPVAPFGATIAGVKALVPEARLLTGPPVAGQYGVTEGQVLAWLDEITGEVAMRLDGWERLPDSPNPRETEAGEVVPDSDREQLRRYARTVIHNGVGSYLEAARHPERAGVNDTSYAAVLWARYTDGLERLATWLERRLVRGGSDDLPGDSSGGVAFSFPCPTFRDGFGV